MKIAELCTDPRTKIGSAFCALAFFVLGAGQTMAADAQIEALLHQPKVIPTVTDLFAWSGIYIGINGGFGWGKATHTALPGSADNKVGIVTIPGSSAGGIPGEAFEHSFDGGLVGGTFGVNWQVHDWLFGLEISADWSDQNGSTGSTTVTFLPTALTRMDTFSAKARWQALATPRVGIVWNNLLVYAKGGLAAGQVDVHFSRDDVAGAPPAGDFLDETQMRVGWTVGGGFDYAVLRNWILGIEADWVDYGTQHYGGITSAAGGGLGSLAPTEELKLQSVEVLGRMTYKFDLTPPAIRGGRY